jgi:hypothetical protein
MKNEIPARRTIAPIAIAIALLPLRPPPVEDVLGVVRTVGAVVVVVCGADCGIPGENGLLDWALAAEGATSVASETRSRSRRTYRSDARGCSIAGVSGASL